MSGTYIIDFGKEKVVRKEISLIEDREYGFMRWYSQLKRLQRFGELFPNVFPKVIRFGRDVSIAYFDIKYIEGSVNGFEFLASDPPDDQVEKYFQSLVTTMSQLHSKKRASCIEALDLYLFEEIERPIEICKGDETFLKFLQYKTIIFNGTEIISLARQLPEIYHLGLAHYKTAWECYTHGNLTLENTLWVPSEDKIWFIDPYEENIADTIYNEYSQVLQSSNSYYEIYNARDAEVSENSVTLLVPPHVAIDYFNEKFLDFLHNNLSFDEFVVVKLYEISQFVRMLPFKLHVAKDKTIFFYSLASFLLHKLLKEVHWREL